MILLCLGVKQNTIINEIENYEINGEKIFKLVKRDKANLYFDTKLDDLDKGCSIIKQIVRSVKYSNAIFFSVFPVVDDKIQWF